MAHNKVYGFCESGCKVEVDPAGKVKPVSEGGTGATDAEQARKNIGAASKQHKHSADDIGGGTIPIANGGTGGSTAREADYNMFSDMGETTNAISDNTLLVAKRISGASATNGALTSKRAALFWTYILGKIRSTFGFTSSNVLPIANGGTGNTTGLAALATKLSNARSIRVNLGSTSSASFDGSANVTPGVNGTLGVANGGTNATTADGACDSIGALKKSGDTMTGTLYAHGAPAVVIGTASDPEMFEIAHYTATENGRRLNFRQYGTNGKRENFNLPYTKEPADNVNYYILTSKNPVTVEQGGTGATSKADALKNLGLEIQTGVVNDVNSTGVSVTFPTAFSGVPVVVASGGSEASSVQVKNVTKTGFKLESPVPNNDGVQWIAIYKS